MLLESPSGDLFGMTQNAGMGWDPHQLLRDQVLIVSTQGGVRGEDGLPGLRRERMARRLHSGPAHRVLVELDREAESLRGRIQNPKRSLRDFRADSVAREHRDVKDLLQLTPP